jgi:sugar phosphate isomerase/epimerase
MRISINVLEEELAEAGRFAREEGIGVEVTAFAYPANLTDIALASVTRHAELLAGITPLSLHGPFFDLVATSEDHEIVAVCRRRHEQAMKIAKELGATIYVAHTNYNGLIRHKHYRDSFGRRLADFWLPFADQAGKVGMTIALENLWEPDPEIHAAAVATARHPHLKASLDTGHALVYSRTTAAAWIRALGDLLAHTHLHDNHGQIDEHLPVGQGIEDWPSLIAALAAHAPNAQVVIENDLLAANRQSFERLRSFCGIAGSNWNPGAP